METNNRRWGARRIVGELRKLGKIVSKSTVLNILKESAFFDRNRRRDATAFLKHFYLFALMDMK
jgi:hypothetical protein